MTSFRKKRSSASLVPLLLTLTLLAITGLSKVVAQGQAGDDFDMDEAQAILDAIDAELDSSHTPETDVPPSKHEIPAVVDSDEPVEPEVSEDSFTELDSRRNDESESSAHEQQPVPTPDREQYYENDTLTTPEELTQEATDFIQKAAKEAEDKADETIESAKDMKEEMAKKLDELKDSHDSPQEAAKKAKAKGKGVVNAVNTKSRALFHRARGISRKDAKKIAAGILGIWGVSVAIGWYQQAHTVKRPRDAFTTNAK